MDHNRMCMACMQDRGGYEVCMHCGYPDGTPQVSQEHLPQRTLLKKGRYLVGRSHPEGAEEVIYAAYDCELGMPVTVHEYFPTGAARRQEHAEVLPTSDAFEAGLRKFLTNARMQKTESGEPLLDSFRENGTVYLVTDKHGTQESAPVQASAPAYQPQAVKASVKKKAPEKKQPNKAHKAPAAKKPQPKARKKSAPGRIVGIVAAILIIALGAGILCTAAQMYTLDVWVPVDDSILYRADSDPYLEALALPLSDPLCRVKVTPIAASMYEQILTAALADGTGPDVYELLPEQKAPEQAMSLADLALGEDAFAEFPLVTEYLASTPDAKALPIGLSTYVLYYNARTGAPNLGEERIGWDEVSAKLTAEDEAGIVWDGPALLALPEAEQALILSGSAYTAGNETDALVKFAEGTLPYLAAGTEHYDALRDDVMGCAVLPLPGEGAYLAECANFFCVSAKSEKELAAAKELLLALYGEEVQSTLLSHDSLPLRASALNGSWANPLMPQYDSMTLNTESDNN